MRHEFDDKKEFLAEAQRAEAEHASRPKISSASHVRLRGCRAGRHASAGRVDARAWTLQRAALRSAEGRGAQQRRELV